MKDVFVGNFGDKAGVVVFEVIAVYQKLQYKALFLHNSRVGGRIE